MAYVPLHVTPLRERGSIMFLEHGRIDVEDSAFVLIDAAHGRTHIPAAGLSCLMLEPGTRITHAAVALAAKVQCLLVWVGEAGVRVYASGQPGGASARHLLYQARIALDETARLNVVRAMYAQRFGETAPERRSVDQLRGLEGVRVREEYKRLAAVHGIEWKGRRYDVGKFSAADVPNQCLSAATACLYGLSNAAILAAGYAPSIGFLHSGTAHAFVYDIADLYKFETVVPAAFATAAATMRDPAGSRNGSRIAPERLTRLACRDAFRKSRLLERIIPAVHDILAASGLPPPGAVSDEPTTTQEAA